MKVKTVFHLNHSPIFKSAPKSFIPRLTFFLFLSLILISIPALAEWPQIALSKDSTPISYEVSGRGEPALVFIHGWNCDARYWRAQVPHFSEKYRVVVLDLAGHGHSGISRADYTMRSFGEDVQAVVEAIGSQKVILIGHSMGGSVIAEAARLLPGRVLGLIGVDTLENIAYRMPREEMEQMLAPFEKDFQSAIKAFIEQMIYPQTDSNLREWIVADVQAAPPAAAISALKEMSIQYVTGEAAEIFEQIRIPVISVNGDLWPIDYEANRRHIFSYDAIVLKEADHFLMMDRPEEFNLALEKAILMLLDK